MIDMKLISSRDIRNIYRTEMFHPSAQWYVLRSLPLGSVSAVIDIGAHVGMFSLLARFLHPNATVLAVEPHAASLEVLTENVSRLNISVFRAALGNGQQFALVNRRRPSEAAQYVAATEQSNPTTFVPSYHLHEFLHLVDKPKLETTFWKIDVEGAETNYVTGNRKARLVLCDSRGFILDVHTDWIWHWRRWVHALKSTHSLQCWYNKHPSACVIAAVRHETPNIKTYKWTIKRMYEEDPSG